MTKKKKGFEDLLDSTINEAKNERENKVVDIETSSEVKTVGVQEIEKVSLSEYVKCELDKIEKSILESRQPQLGFRKDKRKLKWDDVYRSTTKSIRRDLDDLIENIISNASMNKYEVLELILINGLRNTDFN